MCTQIAGVARALTLSRHDINEIPEQPIYGSSRSAAARRM